MSDPAPPPAARVHGVLSAVRERGFVPVLKRALRRRGLNIYRFYYLQETPTAESLARYARLPEGFELSEFGAPEIEVICELADRGAPMTRAFVRQSVARGDTCLGIKQNGEIVGFSWYSVTQSDRRVRPRPLRPNEAYLYNMYVRPEARGHDLAPILRCQVYRRLMAQGRDAFYSITDVSNQPSWRFKQKLGARKLYLGLSLRIGEGFARAWVLKRYGDEAAERRW